MGTITRVFAGAAGVALFASSCTSLTVREPAGTERVADPAAARGGTIRLGIAAPASIDPALVFDRAGALVSSLVCEPLIQLDPGTGRRVAGIAESVESSGGGSVFTIKLRRGVRFHDGNELTAEDVAYTLSRVARHDVAAPAANLLEPVAGYAEIHAPQPPTESGDPAKRRLSGVRVISRTALEVVLGEPNAEFLRTLSLPFAAPVPRELADRSPAFSAEPVCAGPYQLARPYRPGDRTIEVRRFADYYGANRGAAGGGRGYADSIVFRIMADRDAEMRAFETGAIDVAHVPPQRVAEARRNGDQFMTAPLPVVEFVGVPLGQGRLDDPAARALLAAALDRRQLVREVYDGGRLPANGFLPPTLGASDGCAPTLSPRGAAALSGDEKRALRGLSLRLTVNDDFRNRALAQAIARQWNETLDLRVEVEAIPWTQYLGRATSAQGMDSLFRLSWEAPYPSADALIYPLFHSSRVGRDNWVRFDDRAFDRQIDRNARREDDEDARRLKYVALEKRLCTELPLIPITYGQEEYLVRTDRIGAAVRSFFDLAGGQPLLRELFLRQDGREGS